MSQDLGEICSLLKALREDHRAMRSNQEQMQRGQDALRHDVAAVRTQLACQDELLRGDGEKPGISHRLRRLEEYEGVRVWWMRGIGIAAILGLGGWIWDKVTGKG